jgi:hypothetical protein
MNDLKKQRPRLACRFVRAWAAIREREAGAEIGSFEAGLPPAVRRHAAGCPECRRFFIESRVLEQALKRGAAFGMPPIPEGLERRVAAAVAQSQPPEVRAFPWRAFAACGVAAFAIAVFVLEREFRTAEPGSVSGIEAADVTRLATEVNRLPGAIWESAKPSAAAVWTEEPLRREADAVYSDARNAVGFLKANFIPDSGAQAGAEPSS